MRTKRTNIMMARPKEQDRQSVLLKGSELFLGLTGEEVRKSTRRMEEKRFLLGATIGTTRETVTNQMNRFHRMDLVRAHGRHLVVNRRRMADYVLSGGYRRRQKGLGLDKVA